jgi:murein DD-endopeptidase MepM/ murein hydrolase activator NlpD
MCGQQYDPLRARATLVVDGKVRAYCSPVCKEKAQLPPPELSISEPDEEPLPDTPSLWSSLSFRGVAVMGAAGLAVLIFGGKLITSAPHPSASIVPAAALAPAAPTEQQAMAMLQPAGEGGDERWVHPLPGPRRMLPEQDSRRFGAVREGMRPEECEGGHCGVDIGTAKGMPVLCVHDGVVLRVERDPEVGGRRGNEGRFVMVNHKGGTITTSYIHLDAIREDLKPGIPLRAGEAIGLVGDSGVQHSGPHLHFAISVRPSAEGQELYINPEPLLQLWPLARRPAATLHAMTDAVPVHPKTAEADGSHAL